jgi:hypothetical protein
MAGLCGRCRSGSSWWEQRSAEQQRPGEEQKCAAGGLRWSGLAGCTTRSPHVSRRAAAARASASAVLPARRACAPACICRAPCTRSHRASPTAGTAHPTRRPAPPAARDLDRPLSLAAAASAMLHSGPQGVARTAAGNVCHRSDVVERAPHASSRMQHHDAHAQRGVAAAPCSRRCRAAGQHAAVRCRPAWRASELRGGRRPSTHTCFHGDGEQTEGRCGSVCRRGRRTS